MTVQPISIAGAEPQLATGAGGLTRSGAVRLDAIDKLRGLVIILMVLDHVRDFFHRTALTADPLAIENGDPALFMTRWITHLCAPTFVFLAGVSVYLQKANGKSRGDLTRFLLTRGLWLIALELTLVGFGFNFGVFPFFQVIWAIGASFLVLAALILLPVWAVLGAGLLIVVGHNALAPIDPADVGALDPLWRFTFEFGPAPFPGFIAYPFVPWLGIMLIGYGLGHIFTRPTPERTRLVMLLAGSLLLAFAVLRGVNGYGDPRPWSAQDTPLWSALSFIDVTKYPPSLAYTLVTLGVSMALLPALERLGGLAGGVLLTFGRTPLFTYVLHLYVAHGLAVLAGVATGVPASAFLNQFGDPSRVLEAGWGFGLPATYGFWLVTLALLYPLSRWMEGLKRRRRDWWLGYI